MVSSLPKEEKRDYSFLFEKRSRQGPRPLHPNVKTRRALMAITHCSVKNGRAGKGASHARYVQGEGRYASRDDVAHVEHGNMPAFAAVDPLAFWAAADANERANGRAYREVEFAIPRELETEKERIKFAQRFTDKLIGMDHAYTLAIHDKAAADGGRNAHAHLMFTERKNDGIERDAVQFFRRANPKAPKKGGAAKDRALNSRQFVRDTRALYEKTVNRELEARGVAPISMARNDRLEPEPKLGPVHLRAGHDARREARLEAVREIRAARAEWKGIVRQHEALRSEILDLSGDLKAALAERERQQAVSRSPDPAERLAKFRAGVMADLEAMRRTNPTSPAPEARRRAAGIAASAEPKAPDVDALKARSRQAVIDGLSEKRYTVSRSPVNLEHGQYSGKVLLVTDFHVAQDWGRHEAVVHDRTRLTGDYQAGDSVTIRYDSGRGQVARKLDRSQELARRGPRL